MQLKTADHKYANVMEPILNPEDVMIPPNDRTIISIQSRNYAENVVTGILQPSEPLNEENDITFCAAIITLDEGTTRIHVNNFTDQHYKLKKGMHIANVSVMTPEQMKHVRPIDQVSTWHLLNENEEVAVHYISSLLKANKNNDQYEQYWFPTPENPGDEASTRQNKNEYSENYEIYKKQKASIHKKIKNLGKSSSVIFTGKTQCYNSMKSNK